jgi:stress response protein YsnF
MTIGSDGQEALIALHAERVEISKREHVTGRVRVAVETHASETVIAEDLDRYSVEVERVAMETFSDVMPEPRQEGDTLIIPVVQEVVVRRFLVTEEVRIRRTRITEKHVDTVILHHQDAVITHLKS